MLYAPSIFGEDLMDDWFDGFDHMFDRMNRQADHRLYGRHADRLMKTDVREHEDSFELDIDLPGFRKEDLKLQLENGCLTITAAKEVKVDDKEKKEGRLIRRERWSGNMSRTFYVGDQITEEDVKAKFEDGVLKLTVPKKDPKNMIPEKKTIAIEG